MEGLSIFCQRVSKSQNSHHSSDPMITLQWSNDQCLVIKLSRVQLSHRSQKNLPLRMARRRYLRSGPCWLAILKWLVSSVFVTGAPLAYITDVDVLVNSAGIVVTGDTASLSLEDYDRCMNINTKAAFILSQEVIPYLRKSRGNIVHVSSVTGTWKFRLLH